MKPVIRPFQPPSAQPIPAGMSSPSTAQSGNKASDDAERRAAAEVAGVALQAVGHRGERPADVRQKPFSNPRRPVAVRVRRVRVAVVVTVLVVQAVQADPGDHRPLKAHGAADREEPLDRPVRLEGPVREQPVEADRDAEHGGQVHDDQQADVHPRDAPQDAEHDRRHHPDDGECHADECADAREQPPAEAVSRRLVGPARSVTVGAGCMWWGGWWMTEFATEKFLAWVSVVGITEGEFTPRVLPGLKRAIISAGRNNEGGDGLPSPRVWLSPHPSTN